MKKAFFLLLFIIPVILFGQKKPLDHSVYDGWQRVNQRLISNDGKWIVYTVIPQEGDGDLYIQSADKKYFLQVPRGERAVITEGNKFVIFTIKPPYKDLREAKIRKKKVEDMPKDSLGILELGGSDIKKIDKVKSFKVPEKSGGWLAFQKEIKPDLPKKPVNKSLDSLKKRIDSLTNLIHELRNEKTVEIASSATHADTSVLQNENNKGSDLILYNLLSNKEIVFANTGEYLFDKKGNYLVSFVYNITNDSVNNCGVVLYSLANNKADTIINSINIAKNLSFSDDGAQLAFLAESGKDKKALQKFYELYLYKKGEQSALKIADRNTPGMPVNNMVSENGNLRFSDNGSRLFFGTAPVPAPKDTSLVEIDLVKLDIWNYKDDYLQTQQLSKLKNDLRRNYLAVYDIKKGTMIQLGSEGLPTIMMVDEGNAEFFVGATDTGRRVESQWEGRTLHDIYSVNVNTGEKKLIKKNLNGQPYPSSSGKYVLWYDNLDKNYYSFNGNESVNITSAIAVPLYDELNDVPAYPKQYGIMGWQQDDAYVYVYDRYDVWKVDPMGKKTPVNITRNGRAGNLVYRYVKTDPDEKYFTANQSMTFEIFNDVDKSAQIAETRLSAALKFKPISSGNFSFSKPVKARNANACVYTKEDYVLSPDLYLFNGKEAKLSAINPQQPDYNWGTAELFHWTTFKGERSTGIVYKPEDFDSTKKYPVILYFYERLSDNLYKYMSPSPTPSRLNIPFFVSRGYIVFTPDIAYTIGHPGESAYDFIVSGAEALAKNNWVDAKNIGIQGQSWGGYQVAYLITRTNMFKAAWSGAPVVNMFSAYGGIRWESGMNRQFQYEKTQSRIGSTIWEKPDLYVENSPLFHFENVNTPVVIMANDADGAVPWYQGIEMFTALRRLGKPVWMLNYNNEAHNLIERKNRKDIQIREQQFFDWLLKGDKPPRWITRGVKAVDKGIDWGLEIDHE